jgi:hypothetical protein
VFTGLADHDEAADLVAEPEMQIRNVRRLTLRRVSARGDVALRGPAGPGMDAEFEWELDEDGWTTCAGLLEPFLSGGAGHQYLTDEG